MIIVYSPNSTRQKWKTKQRNLRVGDFVLLTEQHQPRREWATGTVTETYPGKDDLVRVVKIRTATGEFKRAVHQLCLLEAVEGRKQSHFAKQSTPALLPASTPALPPSSTPAPPLTSAPISNDGDQRADAWIDHTTNEWNQIPQWNGLTACLPKVKLNEFDGNPANWHDFIGTFKAYCHDVTPVPAQRMQLLKSYLSPRVRSTIAQYPRKPKRYIEALQALRQRYGYPKMIDRDLDLWLETHAKGRSYSEVTDYSMTN